MIVQNDGGKQGIHAGGFGSCGSAWNSCHLTIYSSGSSVGAHVLEAGSAFGAVVSSDVLLDVQAAELGSALPSWRGHPRPSAQAAPQSRGPLPAIRMCWQKAW